MGPRDRAARTSRDTCAGASTVHISSTPDLASTVPEVVFTLHQHILHSHPQCSARGIPLTRPVYSLAPHTTQVPPPLPHRPIRITPMLEHRIPCPIRHRYVHTAPTGAETPPKRTQTFLRARHSSQSPPLWDPLRPSSLPTHPSHLQQSSDGACAYFVPRSGAIPFP